MPNKLFITLIVLCGSVSVAFAQTTAFTYQGKLIDSGQSANGNYDFQFKLFDAVSGGTQQGSTLTNPTVAVSNGVFTVTLDFGVCATCFNGTARFLEIAVRPAGSMNSYTMLAPRQPVTSTPYAIRALAATSSDSLSATCVGCVNGSQIGTVSSSSIPVPLFLNGSTGPILAVTNNGVGDGLQATTNSTANNVSAVAGVVNSTTPGVSSAGVFGLNRGTAGDGIGVWGSHRGTGWGVYGQVSGDGIGVRGLANIGTGSTGFGVYGESLGAFGVGVYGTAPLTGLAGRFDGNVKIQNGLGLGTISTPLRTFQIGADSDALFTFSPTDGMPNAGYIRFGDNTGWKLHFARNRESSGGALNTGTAGALLTIQDNGNVGLTNTSPIFRLHVVDPANTGLRVQTNSAGGTVASFGGNGDFQIDSPSLPGGRMIIKENGRVGIGTTAPDQLLSVNGNASKAGGGSWATYSDERLKNIKGRYTAGLKAILQLQPIRYEYKPDNALGIKSEGEHIGFGAQAVAKVIPEAVMKNEQGYLLINNDPIIWAAINAVKEQQAQIESLRAANAALQVRVRAVEKALRKKARSTRRH
ncbi:MAG: tail fiber domain-containing protein [Acidobacteria bacterium]|nr:tail fiber domain-containing protein [Acidobacteriota bacterium]